MGDGSGEWKLRENNWSKRPYLGTFWKVTRYWPLQSYYILAAFE